MYLTKKDKKIQIQQKIIERLEEENECLKEQLELCNPEHVNKTIAMAESSHDEYMNLIEELNELKEEYQEMIKVMKKDKRKLLKMCR